MGWLGRLFGGQANERGPTTGAPSSRRLPATGRKTSDRPLAGKNVALALVHNPTNVVLLDPGSLDAGVGVNVEMARGFIAKDLARYPSLRSAAAAIQEIVIVEDDDISRDDYAREVTQRYLKHMTMGDWAQPQELHIFETFVGPIAVFVAYGM